MAHRRKQRKIVESNNKSKSNSISDVFDKVKLNLKQDTKPIKPSNNNFKFISIALIIIVSSTVILSFSNFNLIGNTNFTTEDGGNLEIPAGMPSRYDTSLTEEPKLSSAYSYALENGGILSQLICHCGCNNPMHSPYHENNKECFWTKNGTQERHAESCSTCVYIALSAKKLIENNWNIQNIRSFIDKQYQ